MPKIEYKEIRFTRPSLQLIETANAILSEYTGRGLTVTLRQLYYQFVARDFIPNKQTEYKRLGALINDARLAGLIDWNQLQDRTRNLMGRNHWNTPGEVIQSAAYSYHRDLWTGQKQRVEVWIEKDALVGVIERICHRYDVPFFSCRGYTSQSEMWAAAQRLKDYKATGQAVTIIHMGDHDPSGKDMTRDIQERLTMFGAGAKVERIALNINQIRQYNPPPNPAKLTDTRATDYIEEFGPDSWELDALDPDVLVNLLREQIESRIQAGKFEKIQADIERERRILNATANHWTDVDSYIRKNWKDEI